MVAETFLPVVNGVANSVLRIMEHLARDGHDGIVIAPDYDGAGPSSHGGFPVIRVPSAPFVGARGLRVGLPSLRLTAALREFEPDIVHLASPFVLGAAAGRAARGLGVPVVAAFQTNVAAFARAYHAPAIGQATVWAWLRHIHSQAALTLAPSASTIAELDQRGFERVVHWPRGVDTDRFAPHHRSMAWRREHGIGDDEVAVGYVGRLAPEKQLGDLRRAAALPGVRLVLVGDGPEERALRRLFPDAVMTGHLGGAELGTAYASLDVFVHTGPDETFCQGVQEAMASGLPTVGVAAGGVRDLVLEGVTGTSFAAGDAAGVAAAVERYVADADLRSTHGCAARLATLDRSWARVGAQLIEHYEVAARVPVASAA